MEENYISSMSIYHQIFINMQNLFLSNSSFNFIMWNAAFMSASIIILLVLNVNINFKSDDMSSTPRYAASFSDTESSEDLRLQCRTGRTLVVTCFSCFKIGTVCVGAKHNPCNRGDSHLSVLEFHHQSVFKDIFIICY